MQSKSNFLSLRALLLHADCGYSKSIQKRWLKRYCNEHSISLNIKSLEGIIYHLRTGCLWRLLPRHFGTWQPIYHSYRSWSERPWFGRMLRNQPHQRRERCKKFPQTQSQLRAHLVYCLVYDTHGHVYDTDKTYLNSESFTRFNFYYCNSKAVIEKKLPSPRPLVGPFARSHRSCSSLHSLFARTKCLND